MKKPVPARWLVGSLLVLQLTLLGGCGAQQGASPATPEPAVKAVQATSVPTTPITSARPTDTVAVPAPIPTIANPTTAADLATKLAEVPEPTFPPTVTPSRNVAWLVDLLRASQAVTITAIDNPEVQISVDKAGREQLAEVAQSSTFPTVSGDEWLSQYLPFPGYRLEIGVPPYEALVYWASPKHFDAVWLKGPDDNNAVHALYIQENSALWNAVSRMAPVAHYPESSVRYLLDADALRVKMDEFDYTLSREGPHMIGAARDLAYGTLAKEPPPAEEPMLTLYFTVNTAVYEVRVWKDYFTYNGHTYRLEDVGPGIRTGLMAD